MKKFIAFHGSANSGIRTKDEAIKWAADLMTKQPAAAEVHTAEIIEVVERKTPPITVRSFFCATDESTTTVKAA